MGQSREGRWRQFVLARRMAAPHHHDEPIFQQRRRGEAFPRTDRSAERQIEFPAVQPLDQIAPIVKASGDVTLSGHISYYNSAFSDTLGSTTYNPRVDVPTIVRTGTGSIEVALTLAGFGTG